MRDKKFKETGQRLRRIRKQLDMSIVDMAQGCGMHQSTVSIYERGIRLPGQKYSAYLADRHGVNLNFVYGQEETLFLEQREDFDFGANGEDVQEMLRVMTRSRQIRFLLLAHLHEYKNTQRCLVS